MSITRPDRYLAEGAEQSQLSTAVPFPTYPPALNNPVLYESLQDLLRVLWKYRGTIAAVAGGVFLTVLLLCLLTTPKFASKCVIEVNREAAEQNDGSPGSSQIMTQVDDVLTEVATDTNILQNSSLALAVIEKLDLIHHSPFKEAIAANEKGRSLDQAPKTRDKLVMIFAKSLKVERLPDTRLIKITFRSPDPAVASDVVNTLSDLFIENSLKRRIKPTADVSYWIDKELDGLKKQVEDSEHALADYEHKTGMAGIVLSNNQNGNVLDMQTHNPVLDRLTTLNQEFTTAEASRISNEAVYKLIQTQDPELVLGLGGMNISSGGSVLGQGGGLDLLRNLRAGQVPLKTQYAELASKYGSKNSRLLEVKSQLDVLDAEIKSELQRISKRAENDYVYTLKNEKAIKDQLKTQQAVADKLNDDSVHLQVLAQEAFSNRKLYEALFSQLQQASITAGIRATHLSIVERGSVSGVPVVPNYLIALPLAALGGLLLGIVSAFIRQSLDHSVSVPDEVEQAAQLPVVVNIPFFDNGKNAIAVASGSSLLVEAPESPISEAFRSLRTALLFSAPLPRGNTLLITSPVSGDGKTTVVYNLAVAFAQDNARILLIDGDMRNAQLHKLFGVRNDHGLSEALITQAKSLQGLTYQHEKFKNLHLLPGGAKPQLPIELFSTHAFERLLVEARTSYDWILIDSPPFLPLADAAVLSSKVDAILPVLRSGVTSKQMLTTTTSMLRRMRAPVVGFVLNGVKEHLMDSYYSYPYGKNGRGSTMLKPYRTSTLGCSIFCLVAIALFSAAARAQQSAPQIGGTSSISSEKSGGIHISGRGLDSGTLAVVPEDFSKLTLGPGFQLNLQVYDMPEINSQLRIDDEGNVNLPQAGTLHLAGLTLPQAQAAVTKKFADAEILKNPEINLDVIQYAGNNVTVLGEVQSPGRVQLLAPHSLPDVLAMVGGTTITAGNQITISRTVNGKIENQQVNYARSGNSDDIRGVLIQPGDKITVPRAGLIYVLGGVNRPGGYVMQEDGALDVAQALSMAYGTALNAATGSIRVIRKHSDGKLDTIPISYRKMTSGKERPMELQAEDIVYVPVSKMKSILNAGISATISSATIYTIR